MPNYTPNDIIDIIQYWENVIVITNKQQNYIVIVFLTDNTQMIELLHDLYCVNDNVQLKKKQRCRINNPC